MNLNCFSTTNQDNRLKENNERYSIFKGRKTVKNFVHLLDQQKNQSQFKFNGHLN